MQGIWVFVVLVVILAAIWLVMRQQQIGNVGGLTFEQAGQQKQQAVAAATAASAGT